MITIPEISNISYFIITALALIMLPGPAVLFVIANSMKNGFNSGLISASGIGLGIFVHVIGAAIGLSALLMTSAYLFMLVKYIGAGYLIFLGVKSLLSKNDQADQETYKGIQADNKKIFINGFIVSVFNPKTAIFFLAFLPQFINIEKGGISSQLIFLGTLFLFMAALSHIIYALMSSKISMLMSNSKHFDKFQNRVMGCIYIVLGTMALMADRPSDKLYKAD